ncbi:MAG: ABC transporter ATP-binding protein, partial [Oscillospiraceae bacterium]|nr:ABC transporter ATP-binding protein [Oscillospiraceae bacterium]
MAAYQEQEYNRPFELRVWKKLLPFLRPYYKNLVAIVLLNMLMALIDIAMPLFQRFTINHYIEGQTTEGIGWFALLYGGAIVFQTIVVILSTRQSMWVEMKTNRDMKRKAFVHLQTLSFSYYNVTPVGYLIARVMSDTGRISGMLAWGLMDVMWSGVYVIGVL